MDHEKKRLLGSLPVSPTVVSTGLVAIGLVLFGLGSTGQLLLFVVLLLSVLCGQGVRLLRTRNEPERFPAAIAQLLNLARDAEIAEVHSKLVESLEKLSQLRDPIFRQLATERLDGLVKQAQVLSEASIEYASTESWRVAYEQLLRSPGLHLYRSVAHIESVHYWRDGPGTQSTRLNLELQNSRVISVERIAIIADHLWPDDSPFPVEPIHAWLEEQHRHGIWVRLVRESQLLSEANLVTDLGIYGSRAVGIQVADSAGRTIRFVLSFDFDKVQRAEAVWSRLLVYAISYRELLDRQH